MSKKQAIPQHFYFPFCQHQEYAFLKIGAYTWKKRWQVINSYLLKKDTYENLSLYPSLKLLAYVQKNKKLPHPLYNYCLALHNPIDILKHTKEILQFDILTQKTSPSTTLPKTIITTNTKDFFIDKTAQIHTSFMNTEAGPIYIGKNVQIQEGACLRGPIYIGKNSIIKMGATIYGTTIIGANCIIGGEVKNSIIMDNSNKAHYGYLGDSIIGEWCNLGAGTSNSNLKNNVSDINIQLGKNKINAGKKFGLLMGDFSKSAINTSFNTGTVVGISCNIFAKGLTPKYIPNFSWGVDGEKYIFEKAVDDINKWMVLKVGKLKIKEKQELKKIYHEKI
jgi:UDP-N-acetylglucosamine diphosphorylase / glucose-1-phosphate thymidylyltransferase / UDP-N-acetylgalactosamine diphosphorylase / glucosamine-1-phosphate N-acetyltransferase / galactosamine-1-phosphate N-acetyltransferase